MLTPKQNEPVPQDKPTSSSQGRAAESEEVVATFGDPSIATAVRTNVDIFAGVGSVGEQYFNAIHSNPVFGISHNSPDYYFQSLVMVVDRTIGQILAVPAQSSEIGRAIYNHVFPPYEKDGERFVSQKYSLRGNALFDNERKVKLGSEHFPDGLDEADFCRDFPNSTALIWCRFSDTAHEATLTKSDGLGFPVRRTMVLGNEQLSRKVARGILTAFIPYHDKKEFPSDD